MTKDKAMFHHCCSNDRWSRLPKPARIAAYAAMGLLFAAVFVLVFGYVTMFLWNAIMPAISALPAITFWQAAGILVLARLLAGRFSHGSHRGRCRRHDTHRSDRYAEWWEKEGKAAFDAYLRRDMNGSLPDEPNER